MVDFGGWEMPLHYGSQIEEHKAVRSAAGMFDVSHMTIIDLDGPGAFAYLRNLTANDPAKLTDAGHAQYGVLLNDKGGVVDDLIVYRRANGWRAVVNAATRAKVLAWFNATRDRLRREHQASRRSRDDRGTRPRSDRTLRTGERHRPAPPT